MRAPFLSLEELNTSSAEELAATIAGADAEHQRLEAEDKVESQELAQLDEHIDNAEVAAGAFEETAERLEATYPEGVPDEVVQTLEPVLEALKNVVGFKPGSMKVAVEGLSGKERTRVAVEGLKETANKIWEAIKAAFKRMIEFFSSIFTRQGRRQAAVEKKLDAAVEAIEKEIDKLGGDVEPGGEILYPKSCLLSDGKAPNFEKLSHWATSEARTLLDFYRSVLKLMASLEDFCKHKFAYVKDESSFKEVQAEFAEFTKRADAELFEMSHDGTVKSSLGGFQGKFTITTRPQDGKDGANKLLFTLDDRIISGHDAVSGPVIPRDKALALIKDLRNAHHLWPTEGQIEDIPKALRGIEGRMLTVEHNPMLGDKLTNELAHLIKQIMLRMHTYAGFLSWAHGSVMIVMMGISSVCASSNINHAMDAKFGK